MMLASTGSLQTGIERTSAQLTALRARAVHPRPLLLVAALLSLALGAVLPGILAGRRSSLAPAVHVSSHKGLWSLPLAAQGPISGTLGADQAAYRISASVAGLQATNRSQGLQARFGRSGVTVSSRAIQVQMSLGAVGYGTSLRTLGHVTPSANANRVSYSRAGLTEWYANGPLGLEQGFTIPRAPAGHQTGPLTLSIALSGNARAALAPGGQSLELGRSGGSSLRYGGLHVSDARGRAQHSWLELNAGHVLLRVDVRGARYPLRIDPFIQRGEKLTGAGETGEGRFAFSVALSSDGSTALIGGLGDHESVGAAWVFTRSGEAWTQQAKLTGGGEVGNAGFGSSVALSADGNRALIGGSKDNNSVGAAWVFTRSGEAWSQQVKLTGSGEIGGGSLGTRVALSSDGSTALVSGPTDNSAAGAGWIFTRSGEAWTQQAKLTASEEIGPAKTGYAAALSDDGATVILGGYADNSRVGAAWVFTRSGEAWTQQAKLTAGEEIGKAEFGESVALSSAGATALIGGEADNNHAGAAWVFTRSGEAWTQQAKLTASDQVGRALFANYSVVLSSDGNTALVSGWGDNSFRGAVWVFTRSGEVWSELEKLTPSGEVGQGHFGLGSALSADGSTALIGAPDDNSAVGAAWVFAQSHTPIAVTGSASLVTPTSATLNATVNPGGETVSDCHFEYGTTMSYGTSIPCTPLPGGGESPVAVSAQVESLIEHTSYHFRIVATNPSATSYGADNTFTTPRSPPNPPEFGRCLKLATGATGQYSTATCTAAATAEKHSYEWEPGPGPKAKFTTKIKATTLAKLETAKKHVVCTGQSGAGEYTGPKTVGNVSFTFTGCEMSGVKCSSLGAQEGEMVTGLLHGGLGIVKTSTEGPLKNTIGIDLLPVAETGVLLEFSCGATPVTVRGSVIVPVTRNVMKLTTTLLYAQSKGKQKPESFTGEPKDVLEASFGEAPYEQLGLGLTTIKTDEQAMEVNSVA